MPKAKVESSEIGPVDRCANFAFRRGWVTGEFIKSVELDDGYTRVEFAAMTLHTVTKGKAVYLDGPGYPRPVLPEFRQPEFSNRDRQVVPKGRKGNGAHKRQMVASNGRTPKTVHGKAVAGKPVGRSAHVASNKPSPARKVRRQ